MKPAYRIPVGKFPLGRALHHPGDGRQHADHRDGGQLADHQPPRRRQSERRQGHGQRHRLGRRLRHRTVEVSTDGGKTWGAAPRPGSRPLRVPPVELRRSRPRRASNTVMVRATNKIGQTPDSELIHNPAGYHHNVMQNITLTCAEERHHAHNSSSHLSPLSSRSPAFAAEQADQAEAGTGRRQGRGQLRACHSLDYILMNSPFLNAAGWERRGHQDDQGLWRTNRRRRCQGDRRLSGEKLR